MDKRALKILLDTYWAPSGWTRQEPNAEDYEYAKSRRAMFDPVLQSHGEVVARIRPLAEGLTVRQVVDGFLASLSTRRLDWRSALGSYSVARWLPNHEATTGERQCRVCGLYDGQQEYDLSILNFERFKWGGVRHSNPVYAALDLELFQGDPPTAPTAEDIGIFRDLVAALAMAPASATSASLNKYFPTTLRANKSERDQVVAIMGLCGVIGTREHPGFAEQFVPYSQRILPDRHFVDMAYPACWWRASDGVNEHLLHELFGHVL